MKIINKRAIPMLLGSLLASGAFAQSSVQIYGILDAGLVANQAQETTPLPAYVINGNKLNASLQADKTETAKSTAFRSGASSASRLGFKGTEDLGNGTSVNFLYEVNIDPAQANQTLTSRQAYVGLKNNSWGEARIGYQYTPIHTLLVGTHPLQGAQIAGTAVGINPLSSATGAAPFNKDKDDTTSLSSDLYNGLNTVKYDARNTGLNYFYEKGAFYTSAGYTSSGDTSSSTQGNLTSSKKSDASGWQIGFGVKSLGGFTGGLAYQNGTQNGSVDYTGLGKEKGKTKKQSLALAGSYELPLGIKPYAIYLYEDAKSDGTVTGELYNIGGVPLYGSAAVGQNLTSQKFELGSSMQVTPSVLITAGVLTGTNKSHEAVNIKLNGAGSASGHFNTEARIRGYNLGSTYTLSKRTNLYALYGYNSIKNDAYGASNRTVALGVRHTF